MGYCQPNQIILYKEINLEKCEFLKVHISFLNLCSSLIHIIRFKLTRNYILLEGLANPFLEMIFYHEDICPQAWLSISKMEIKNCISL